MFFSVIFYVDFSIPVETDETEQQEQQKNIYIMLYKKSFVSTSFYASFKTIT